VSSRLRSCFSVCLFATRQRAGSGSVQQRFSCQSNEPAERYPWHGLRISGPAESNDCNVKYRKPFLALHRFGSVQASGALAQVGSQ
jgi:hypothetical protein